MRVELKIGIGTMGVALAGRTTLAINSQQLGQVRLAGAPAATWSTSGQFGAQLGQRQSI